MRRENFSSWILEVNQRDAYCDLKLKASKGVHGSSLK